MIRLESFAADFNKNIESGRNLASTFETSISSLPAYITNSVRRPSFVESEAWEGFFSHVNKYFLETYSVNLDISKREYRDFLDTDNRVEQVDPVRFLAYIESKLEAQSLSELGKKQEIDGLRNSFKDNIYQPNVCIEYLRDKKQIKHLSKFSRMTDDNGEIWLLPGSNNREHPLKRFFYNVGGVVDYLKKTNGIAPNVNWESEYRAFLFSVNELCIKSPDKKFENTDGYPYVINGRATTSYLFKKHDLSSSGVFDSIQIYKNGNVVYAFPSPEMTQLFYEQFVQLTPIELERKL